MAAYIYIIMGVSGCGKTTIGKLLAEKLTLSYIDADDFHSESNIKKMANGIPLTDEDRQGWLTKIHHKAIEFRNTGAVIACSALKEKYRILLNENLNIQFVYLEGSFELIFERLQKRKNHFMSAQMLQSQFDILEIPKNALKIEIEKYLPEEIVDIIMNNKKEFGLVGLGVMGKSLARNFARNGIALSLYNRFVKDKEEQVAEKFIAEHNELSNCEGFENLKQFGGSLDTPRKIFLMINAGKVIDGFIDELLPFLSPNDTIIEGGNSHFLDTKRRIDYLEEKQINFIGTGVSGGEQGALWGPSIMPSGNENAYNLVSKYLEKIAAKDKNNQTCCTYIGPDGSGHFVKMVHNGMEYAEMQLIAEVYGFLRYAMQKNPDEISVIFSEWNKTEVQSYLLEISSKILKVKDGENYLIDDILDQAGNKGTGNWATLTASEHGIPANIITSALFARYFSTIRNELVTQTKSIENTQNTYLDLESIKNAYQLSRIMNHQQGFYFINKISKEFNWKLNLSEIARIWTNGCIIRSKLMEELALDLRQCNEILEIEKYQNEIIKNKVNLKKFVALALENDLPLPTHFSVLDYLNQLYSGIKTANMIQAQRDFFGAHTYKRISDASGKAYHTHWEG